MTTNSFLSNGTLSVWLYFLEKSGVVLCARLRMSQRPIPKKRIGHPASEDSPWVFGFGVIKWGAAADQSLTNIYGKKK